MLAKQWPDATRFADIRDCGIHNLEPVEIICGGFPCQDISQAGKQAGLDGERSSLWWQMRRIVGELRPRYVIVENVPNLFIRGFDRVLGSLSEIGYDAEWGVISANDVGAPHLRQRLWIVAYTIGPRLEGHTGDVSYIHQPGRVASGPDGSVAPESVCERTEWHHLGWVVEPNVGRVAHGVSRRVDRLRGLGNAIVPQIAYWLGTRIKDAQ